VECCDLPKRGSGWSPDRLKVFHALFSALRMASPDTVILLLIMDHTKKTKKNEKFLFHIPFLQPIIVHLGMLSGVFLKVYETKFTVGRSKVMVFIAGKRRGR